MKTTTLKKSEFKKEWHVLDATDISVGRLASRVSLILKGKNKPQFSPNLPVGDGVIIVNTDKVKFSGNKNSEKKYYKHTGHPGGIKEITPDKLKEKNFIRIDGKDKKLPCFSGDTKKTFVIKGAQNTTGRINFLTGKSKRKKYLGVVLK